MKNDALNPQVFLETTCYVTFAAVMLYLALSGKYLTYIAPRMKPYLYFSAAVMLAWSFFNLRRMYRPQHIVRSLHCLVLAVPILLLLLPHRPLDASSISAAYVGGTLSASAATPSTALEEDEDAPPDPAAQSGTFPEVPEGLPGLDVAARRFDIPDDAFYECISELYLNTEAYVGYTVSMTGYVLKDPEFGETGFVPARLAMSCCVADLVPMGMICMYDALDSLEDGAWVTVEGALFQGVYMGGTEPQLRVTRVTPAEEIEGYIYIY